MIITKETNFQKINKIIRNFIIIFLLLAVLLNLSFWNSKQTKNSLFNSFGMAIVLSNSMKPELSKYDLIIIKKLNDYQIGDVVVYQNGKSLIVHRIIDKTSNKITTKGDANNREDMKISIEEIYGKVQFSIPFIGYLFVFLKSNYGIFSIIFLIIFLFIYSCKKEMKVMKNEVGEKYEKKHI